MSDTEDKKSNIVSLLQSATPPARTRKRSTPAKSPTATGSNVIQLNGGNLTAQQVVVGNVNNYNVARPPRPRVVVTPGEGVVTDTQKAKINELRLDWIALHNSIKKAPLTDAAAWVKINRKAGTTSYHLIPGDRYDLVIKYIKREMATLRAMRSAPRKDATWRTTRISAIKARSKNQHGSPDAYRPYIAKNFGAKSLTDLSDDELQRTYSYIMAKKPAAQAAPEFPDADTSLD